RASLCFLRLPPSLLPPLFPYTTLFRSKASRIESAVGIQSFLEPSHQEKTAGRPSPDGDPLFHFEGCLLQNQISSRFLKPSPELLDRKSTRLHSSHVKISYAVFCLKKKT